MVVDPEDIEWDEANVAHATRHGISTAEITQVLLNNPTIRRNRKGRSGDHYAVGMTNGGRKVVVAVSWEAERRIIRPITAWER